MLTRIQPIPVRNRIVLLADVLLILISVLGSFALRLDVAQLPYYLPAIITMSAVATAVKLPVYYLFGLYRRLWVYASTSELRLITAAVSAASVLTASVMLVLIGAGRVYPGMPRSALGIDWLLSLVLIGGSRFALRILAEQSLASHPAGSRRVLVVGAGNAGALIVRELQKSPRLNMTPAGFIDDDPAKQHQGIYGVPVLGTLSDLAAVLQNQTIDEVIIAIPSAPGRVVRHVSEVCRRLGIPYRTMPSLFELIGGKVHVSQLRQVNITDLLRREPVSTDDRLVGAVISGKRVLVTGAGGSIGREIARQAARWGPSELALLGHGENSISETLLFLRNDFPGLSISPIIADVREADRMADIAEAHRPEVIFHAAAHKHVPLMEVNVEEAVLNNVVGTDSVVNAAIRSSADRLVLISTDKAVRPANVYGATKRVAEMIVVDAAQRGGRAFSVVRFGNVLGSRGSVIPLFQQQIARGGPVLVTHPDMTRYFMTIPEAVHLVMQASSLGNGGEIFILDMGAQIKILDLAEDLIRLSGLEPGRDIEIAFTGIRPGEKLREELWEEGARFTPTSHPMIFRAEDDERVNGGRLSGIVDQLARLAHQAETRSILQLLDDVIPSASVRSGPPPDMTSVE